MAENHAGSRVCMKMLHEYCQRNKLTLEFQDVNQEGPPHNPIFTVVVVIDKKKYSPATGKSKKEAKEHAAKNALETIERKALADSSKPLAPPASSPPPSQPPPPPQIPTNLPEASPSASCAINYVSWLNEYVSKNRISVKYTLTTHPGYAHTPMFYYVCQIGSTIFGEGAGNKKGAAKCNAAKAAYEQLNAQQTSRTEGQSTASASNSTDPFVTDSQEIHWDTSMNDADSDSESKGAANGIAEAISTMKLNDISSSSSATPPSPAVKSKRKGTMLAPSFSNTHQKKSKYTVNERFLQDFEDITRIGLGGFGKVFKAKHAIDKRERAVKRVILDDEEEEERKHEVETLAKLDHENIVRYYGCWIGKDTEEDSTNDNCSGHVYQYGSSAPKYYTVLFIEMEFCEKGTLRHWIEQKRKGKVCEDTSVKFQQIVAGVSYIHFQNLIHRDLKPENIFISREDKIKIGDFGLATSGIDDFLRERTKNKGTASYMAPEQVGNTYGKEVDIFPLGLIWLEMLYIFQTDSEKIKEWRKIRKGELPGEFVKKFLIEGHHIKKLLSKEPSERPSASELVLLLNNKLKYQHTC